MAVLAASLTTAATAGPLDALRWKKRVLLVFAADETLRRTQLRALAGDAATERDLVVLGVPDGGAVSLDGVGTVDGDALRRAYAVASDDAFTAILLGKDGGIKRRSSRYIPARDLFATIDAMLMRADEMRRD